LSRTGNQEAELNPSKRMEAAHGYLHLYATAKLVITARIHAALPCIAFRTPVIYVHGNGPLDGRISDFMDFVPHTTVRDMLTMNR
jgi:exopolysaccharide biosynthesis predicted pyruvyltransferase EpsI